jgi:hypothetical protein
VNRYKKWSKANGNKATTISLLFLTLRSAYNKAVKAKCAKKANYPFDEYKISWFDIKTKKRAVSKDDILKVMNLDLKGEKNSLRFARDIFVFSYLCGGMSFSDIANLTEDNVINGRIEYQRQKTWKRISIHLS